MFATTYEPKTLSFMADDHFFENQPGTWGLILIEPDTDGNVSHGQLKV